jgi:hypothetical protein
MATAHHACQSWRDPTRPAGIITLAFMKKILGCIVDGRNIVREPDNCKCGNDWNGELADISGLPG